MKKLFKGLSVFALSGLLAVAGCGEPTKTEEPRIEEGTYYVNEYRKFENELLPVVQCATAPDDDLHCGVTLTVSGNKATLGDDTFVYRLAGNKIEAYIENSSDTTYREIGTYKDGKVTYSTVNGAYTVFTKVRVQKLEQGTYNMYSYRGVLNGNLRNLVICSQATEDAVCQVSMEVGSNLITIHNVGGDIEIRYRVEGNEIYGYYLADISTEYVKIGTFVDDKITILGSVDGAFQTFVKAGEPKADAGTYYVREYRTYQNGLLPKVQCATAPEDDELCLLTLTVRGNKATIDDNTFVYRLDEDVIEAYIENSSDTTYHEIGTYRDGEFTYNTINGGYFVFTKERVQRISLGTYNMYTYRGTSNGQLRDQVICSQATEDAVCHTSIDVESNQIIVHNVGGDIEIRYRVEGNEIHGYYLDGLSTEYVKIGTFTSDTITLDGTIEGAFMGFLKIEDQVPQLGIYNIYMYEEIIQGASTGMKSCDQSDSSICAYTIEVTEAQIIIHPNNPDTVHYPDVVMNYKVRGNAFYGYYLGDTSTEYKRLGTFVDNKVVYNPPDEGTIILIKA